MIALRAAVISCDECGQKISRLAPPRTRHTVLTESLLRKAVQEYALRQRWQIEGVGGFHADDLCPRCRVFEQAAA